MKAPECSGAFMFSRGIKRSVVSGEAIRENLTDEQHSSQCWFCLSPLPPTVPKAKAAGAVGFCFAIPT